MFIKCVDYVHFQFMNMLEPLFVLFGIFSQKVSCITVETPWLNHAWMTCLFCTSFQLNWYTIYFPTTSEKCISTMLTDTPPPHPNLIVSCSHQNSPLTMTMHPLVQLFPLWICPPLAKQCKKMQLVTSSSNPSKNSNNPSLCVPFPMLFTSLICLVSWLLTLILSQNAPQELQSLASAEFLQVNTYIILGWVTTC
jgi:hypothetical protein